MTHRRTSPWRAARAVVAAGLLAVATACTEQTTEPTPTPPVGSLALVPNLRAEDLSADGATVLLTDPFSSTAEFYFYDIAAGTTTLKGAAGDALADFTTGISNGLRVSAIHGIPEQAGLWEQATNWLDLGNIYSAGCVVDDLSGAQNMSGGWDIDSAGHAAVGLVWNGCNAEAFYWSDAGGAGAFTTLDQLGTGLPDGEGGYGAPVSRATVVSDNGMVAAGWASDTATVGGYTYGIDRRPAIWQSNGVGMLIPGGTAFSTDSPGEVLAIGGDGSVVVGVWNQKPFVYSAALGAIDLAPGDFFGYAQAVALDGQLVFGTYTEGFFGNPVPFVWTQAGGLKSILDIAAENDITLPENYWWQAIVAASADGSVVVGVAYDEAFNLNTYVLKLPVSAYGL